ncbi:hypothetical protein Y032_0027g1615 [Ancylostoma ceylanicum]|uniref:Uncharacterized protein n=1 Tax=Ancylostoma ceylanicum TaxID=53326 RepID=A0A016UVZ4_9BILA|nr:hypothetical protein Y032_0027g1615 [Ancylostoma ceylanicum]
MTKCYIAAIAAFTLSLYNVDFGLLATFYGCRSKEYLMGLCHGFLRQETTHWSPQKHMATNVRQTTSDKWISPEEKVKHQHKTGNGGNSSSPDVSNSTGGTKSKSNGTPTNICTLNDNVMEF